MGWTVLRSTPGIPSTTTSGALLADKEVPPRKRMEELFVGSPPPCETTKPATLPCNNCSAEEITPCLKSLAETEAIEPVKSDLRETP